MDHINAEQQEAPPSDGASGFWCQFLAPIPTKSVSHLPLELYPPLPWASEPPSSLPKASAASNWPFFQGSCSLIHPLQGSQPDPHPAHQQLPLLMTPPPHAHRPPTLHSPPPTHVHPPNPTPRFPTAVSRLPALAPWWFLLLADPAWSWALCRQLDLAPLPSS